MIKVFGIVILTLLIIVILKGINSQFAFLLSVFTAFLLLAASVTNFSSVIETFKHITDSISGMNSFVTLMLKLLGISVAAQFLTSLCSDMGENALSNQLELYSKVFMLVVSMPLFESVLNIISGLVK